MKLSKLLKYSGVLVLGMASIAQAQNPIHVTYLWHMHQPVYFPYESVNDTDNNNRFVYSVKGIHDERFGNYTDWPKNAVQQGADRGLPNAGVQVSFSGSLMENLNGIWGLGWRDHWRWGRNGLRTTLDNPRLDLVGFAYHHSLMPLTSYESMRMQIRLHREAYIDNWNTGGSYSKGFFPPESSFALHMIPALVDEGIEWVMVDSGHFDRTLEDFPWSPASSIRPNRSELRNGTAGSKASQWVQLQNVWAPTPVAAPFSYQPHRVRYVDPHSSAANPTVKSMIAVPAARYEGNENGRGGYGAFKPENVWGSNVDKNNNAQRPMIILCHSDGDNFGMKNADAFHGQHGLFLNMIQSNPNFSHTTVQDYLDMYPVPANDFIHVEAGSWIGIDGGTPYFDKWIENNSQNNQHPDYWSWSVVVAAQNRVLHAESLENNYSMNDVRWGIGSDTAKAWRYFLQAETSCHWYWDYDTANPWDGNATRGANLAIIEANKVINRHPGVDNVGPAIFHPQRRTWNPGGKHWNEPNNQPSDFEVWTFADDVNGVASVTLKWRTGDFDSYKNLNDYAHELYAHTPGKNSAWNSVPMSGAFYPTAKGPNVPDPINRAMMYSAMINGASNTLVSYYIEAVDTVGNTNKTHILHVWVGESTGGGGGTEPRVVFDPPAPDGCEPVTIKYRKSTSQIGNGPIYIHVGRNGWQNTIIPNPQMTDDGDFWSYTYNTPDETETINVVFNNGAGAWDNNGGIDWQLAVTGCSTGGGGGPISTVWIDPESPEGCGPITIHYNPAGRVLQSAQQVYIHIGRNDGTGRWKDVILPNPAMTLNAGVWSYQYTPLPGTEEINFVFNNGQSTWDNNTSLDWNFVVTGCEGGEPPPTGFAITSPASNLIVGNGTETYDLAGIADGVVGHITWTNDLTGASGLLPVSSPWTIPGVALAVGTNVITVSGTNQIPGGAVTSALDSASNYGGVWTNGSNQGTGFGPWALSGTANAGQFIGAHGFGFWSHEGTNLSQAVRPISSSLSAGESFHVRMKNGWIWENGGSVGVALWDAMSNTVWQLYFNGGDAFYSRSGGSTDIGWTDGGLDIVFTLMDASTYSVSIQPVAGGALRTYTGTVAGAITAFRAWSFNNGTNDENNGNRDYFVNNLKITGYASGNGVSTSDTVIIVRQAVADGDSNSDGIPDSWYQKYGVNHMTPGQADNDIPGGSMTYREAFMYDLNPTNPPGHNPNKVIYMANDQGMTLRVEAPTSTNRWYDVFWSTSLVGGAWTPMGMNVPGNIDNSPVTLIFTNSSEIRYFRTGAKATNP